MLNTSFAIWPSFTEEEADAVRDVILSNKVNYWTGQECRQFEQEFAEWAGCEHAVAVSNGTLALDVALKALNIGPGDEVVVTPRTFLASVSCIINAGAVPVFADVDRDSQNITAQTVQAVLTPRTRAVICVHLAGWPCDMDPIMALANERGFYVIEDCAQAHGALYKGRPVGSIGHIGAWSFCQDKIMTTGGEGGMTTTNDSRLWSNVVAEGPWKKLGRHLQTAAPARLPLVARKLWNQLADDRNAGGNRPHSVAEHAALARIPARAGPGDLGNRGAIARAAGTRAGSRCHPCRVQMLCLRRTRNIERRLEP